MKPKLLAIQYGDKVLLAALVALLIWSLMLMQRTLAKGPSSYTEEMRRNARQIGSLLQGSRPPSVQAPEAAKDLAQVVASLRTPPVISPLPIGPLIGTPKKTYNQQRALIDQTTVFTVPGQMTGIIVRPKHIDVKLAYDPASRSTVISITGVIKTAPREVRLVLKDRDNLENVIPIIVFEKEPEIQPLPLRDTLIAFTYGRVVLIGILQQPAGPTRPGAGAAAQQQYVRAESFRVYRKWKDAPDDQYRLLSPEAQPLQCMLRSEFLKELTSLGLYQEAFAGAPAVAPGAPAELQGTVIGAGPVLTDERIYCLYKDRTVTPGEAYDYKMVAVPAKATGLDKAVEGDFAPLTIEVPLDTLFFADRFPAGQVNMLVVKYFFDQMYRVEQRFSALMPGDLIGGVVNHARMLDLLSNGSKGFKDNVDMASGAYVVDVVENGPKYAPTIRFVPKLIQGELTRRVNPKTGEIEIVPGRTRMEIERHFELTTKPKSYVVYLDKKGNLDAKYLGLPEAGGYRPKLVPPAVRAPTVILGAPEMPVMPEVPVAPEYPGAPPEYPGVSPGGRPSWMMERD